MQGLHIHLLSKCLLNFYYVPTHVLEIWDIFFTQAGISLPQRNLM